MADIMNAFADKIIIPIIAILGTAIVVILQKFADRVAKSIELKHQLEDIEKEAAIRERIVGIIAQCVESAVGSNMQLADSMKTDGKLTTEQVKQLQDSAKKRIWDTLPYTLTREDSALYQIIGGREKIDALIDTMIEQYVYEFKSRKATTTVITTTEQPKRKYYNNKKKKKQANG